MFSCLAGQFRCAKEIHDRSKRHIIRISGGGHISVYRYRRVRMKRCTKRDWQLISRKKFEALTR